MAATVGRTLAFATLRVFDGEVKGRGVREGVLERLEEAGVKVVEE